MTPSPTPGHATPGHATPGHAIEASTTTRRATNDQRLDERRWRAVCERDTAWDGRFVFAVLTTGVYCRPGCPARRALRENVSFFDTPERARAAGYRPCKRCGPDEAGGPPHREAVVRACRMIQSEEEEPALAALAESAGLSPGHFQRVFKAEVGLSPKRYAMAVRKQRLREELKASASATDAIYDAGYSTASRAYADRPAPGLTPGRYSKGARGETIRYANTGTSLGNILIAATERGVCLVEFVEQDKSRSVLERHFPSGELREAGEETSSWISEIVALIDEPRMGAAGGTSIPLDIRGTAFQEKVWRALTDIPCGRTVSYAGLARSIGQPGAARAVAGACAANRLAVVVPCHRVTRGSGEPGGYRWGAGRKESLLKKEAGDG